MESAELSARSFYEYKQATDLIIDVNYLVVAKSVTPVAKHVTSFPECFRTRKNQATYRLSDGRNIAICFISEKEWGLSHAAYLASLLSVIRQDIEAIGHCAAELLIEPIRIGRKPQQLLHRIPVDFVQRSSISPPRRR